MADFALSRRIAEHVLATDYTALSPQVVAATKRSLLDALGVMMAATRLGEGTDAFARLAVSGPNEGAVLIGRGRRAPLLAAVLANGALAHAIDFEDGHDGAPVHPNAVQTPAVLGLAEALGGVSGRDLIAALAVGCDLACRLGLALTTDPARLGWYPPPILGGFGAAAACARLARLSPQHLVDAFSLLLCSSTCSGEIKYSPRSEIRAVRDAFPAQAAVQAVLLAREGVTGFDAPLEGKAGFFALYAQGGYDQARLVDGLGERFEGENLTLKAWPSCRGTHAFIEGALSIRQEAGFSPEKISEVRLRGHPVMRMLDEPHDAKRAPATAIDAKFSAPFTTATALHRGAVGLESFSPEALREPDIRALADRISFEVIENAPPGAIAAGGIMVRMDDGREFERFIAQPLGSPANPLDAATLETKFRECASYAVDPLAPHAVEQAIGLVDELDNLPDLAPLFAILGPNAQ
jgi:2-methylcitrate dehydratase PrpD